MARRVTLCFFIFISFARVASAQSGSAYFAGGTATDSSAGPLNTLGAGVTLNTPSMGGFFETVGGDVIFRNRIGVGAEYSFRKDRGAYAGIAYLPAFYDVNAVYYPFTNVRRISPEIQAGVGRSKLTFYDTPGYCLTAPQGCPSSNAQIESLDTLQVHFAGGVRVSVWRGIFLRPQIDLRWMDKFPDFGSPWVVEYTVAVGYTFHSLRPKIPSKH